MQTQNREFQVNKIIFNKVAGEEIIKLALYLSILFIAISNITADCL